MHSGSPCAPAPSTPVDAGKAPAAPLQAARRAWLIASLEAHARRDAPPAKKLGDAHAPAAGRLQLVDGERAGSAGDVQRCARIEHGARSAGTSDYARAPDLHRLAAEARHCAG